MEFGVNTVGAGYFETMGIPLVRGRGFEPSDREGSAAVAVVNESFARRFWPGENALGRRFSTSRGGIREIVGIAQDGKYVSLTEDPEPHFYEPFAQAYEADMVLLARTSGDPRELLPLLAREARALDPELPVEVDHDGGASGVRPAAPAHRRRRARRRSASWRRCWPHSDCTA